jgi:hypothetical protein
MTNWAARRLRFAGFPAWRFLEPFYESSDLSGAWPHTDPTLRKDTARGRDDWGNGYAGCAAGTGNRLVTDITQVILQFRRDRGDGLSQVLFRACRRRRLD